MMVRSQIYKNVIEIGKKKKKVLQTMVNISKIDSAVSHAASRKTTILLVEDEVLIAMKESQILQKHGYEVITANNAQKAIEAAASPDIDLILMDIDLGKGKMDGTEAAELILRQRELPIVFVTSHTEREMVERVKGITRYGYVVKNSGEFVLLEAIQMAFELFNAHRDLQTSESKYKTIFANSPLGIFRSTPEGRFLEVNTALADMLGAPLKTLNDSKEFP